MEMWAIILPLVTKLKEMFRSQAVVYAKQELISQQESQLTLR